MVASFNPAQAPQSLQDRYRGVLLGVACGDALGGPVEFQDRAAIAQRFPNGVREFVGGGWLDLDPGEITDDTQQTLILCRALTEGGLDLGAFGEGLLEWYRSAPKDIGNTTLVALRALAAGTPPSESGEAALAARGERSAAANGAVMRCAPIALRFRADPAALVQTSLASAKVTHAESRAAWGAVAVNQALVHLLSGGAIGDVPAAAVAGIPDRRVSEAVLAAADMPKNDVAAGGFVLETIGAAFWALANFPTAEEVIVQAVSLGEDADSTGAVAGALAGAVFGAQALPNRWQNHVQFREELVEQADRLLGISGGAG
ncbi:MAG: ADP-ribosylglycohydrolase family protein [Thermomicrobiales bacterium]|nr:ADP-ribosylglycohydrolase family protein [Thermomicrobiales bacterium]MCA9877710.1 ADP-ribosylglycohydrolase family protein [Thermomicrobiales bacterium]